MISILLLAAASPLPAPTLPALAPASVRSADQFDDALRAANSALVVQLEELADWCQKNKAFLERNRVYEEILEHDPDHKKGRKMLGYTFDRKAEEWVRKRAYLEPKPSKPAVALEAAEQKRAVYEAHLERLMGLLDGQAGGSDRQRAKLLDDLIKQLPQNEELRRRKGHVKLEGEGDDEPRWLMQESVRAIELRKELRKRLKDLRAEFQKPENDGPSEDYSIGLEWEQDLSTDRVQLYATSSSSEAQRTIEFCHILWDYTRDLLDHDLEPSYTVYLISKSSHRSAVQEYLADGNEKALKSLKRVAGMGQGGSFYQWPTNSAARTDGACRQSLLMLLNRRFGIDTKNGWASEGFGMYLTDRMLGTRLTYFIRATEYEDNSDREVGRAMRDPNANWFNLARKALGNEKKKPNLAFTLGRDVNNLTPTDLVVSYALAAYLMEGQPQGVAAKVLGRVGAGENAALVLEDELGMDLYTLRDRLHTWLTEIRG